MINRRATHLLALALACSAAAGCNQVSPGAMRQVTTVPELYWERAQECRKRQIKHNDEECKVSVDELRVADETRTADRR